MASNAQTAATAEPVKGCARPRSMSARNSAPPGAQVRAAEIACGHADRQHMQCQHRVLRVGIPDLEGLEQQIPTQVGAAEDVGGNVDWRDLGLQHRILQVDVAHVVALHVLRDPLLGGVLFLLLVPGQRDACGTK